MILFGQFERFSNMVSKIEGGAKVDLDEADFPD